MYFQANIGGSGHSSSDEPVLLWTNPSPTAAFGAQTISLNLTDYAGALIEFDSVSTGSTRVYIKKGEVNFAAGVVANGSTRASREVSCDNTGVTIGSTGTTNTLAIPTKIYGVKEYVVEVTDRVLMWTNPNPSLDFAAQTIPMDLSDAIGIIIEAEGDKTNSHNSKKRTTWCDIGGTSIALGIDYGDHFGAGMDTSGRLRTVSCTATEVVFGDALYAAASSQASQVANSYAIPTRIWKIK